MLVHEMEKVLSAGKQVILFQNRRGIPLMCNVGNAVPYRNVSIVM